MESMNNETNEQDVRVTNEGREKQDKREMGPWSDVATARLFLAGLAAGKWSAQGVAAMQTVDRAALAAWLVRQGLAPLAYRRCRDIFPELAAQLASAFYRTAAGNTRRFHELSQVLDRFRAEDIPVVLLKGAALAEGAYGGLSLRPMGDVDLWLRAVDMPGAAAIMQALGFRRQTKDDRPLALQFLSRGEIQFYGRGLIELHWSPFPGWWLCRTAAVDDDAAWERKEPLALDGASSTGGLPPREEGRTESVYQLAAEDMVIHVAVHMAVNHQFGMVAVRGLMDVALTARARPVDWALVAERARRWRVGTAVWTVLDLAEQLLGLPDADGALVSLRPSAARRL